MKCATCGRDNPDDNKFCGQCGSPLGSAVSLTEAWQKRHALHTGLTFVAVSILLIIIGFGIKGTADGIDQSYFVIKGPLRDIAFLFFWLGAIGFAVSGFAYLLSLPTPRMWKTPAVSEAQTETKDNMKIK